MKNIKFSPALLAMTILVGACSTAPKSTSLLDQTRFDYLAVQNNQNIMKYAPLEMQYASDALDQANIAASNNESTEKINKLAYLAKQKIALTEEVAKRKAAEANIASAGSARDRVILNERTNQVDQAKITTQQAELTTQEAQKRAALLEVQLADLSAKKTDRGIVITLGDVLFDTSRAHLNGVGMRTTQKLARFLQKNQQRTVLIEGFTDNTGTASYNQALSERRAATVRRALQHMGISNDRITIQGYGAAYPVAANDTVQNRQFNRRVEIILSDENGTIMPR